MRVASVAFTNYDADPRVRRMAEALAARGDEVVAITLRQPGQSARRWVRGVRVYTVNSTQYQGTSITTYLLQYAAFVFASMKLLTRLHFRRRFDVIHINNMPDFLVFAAVPAKLLGAKVILDLHDPMPELFAAKFDGGPSHPAVRLVKLAERLSIGFADRAIAVQSMHLDTFVGHGNPRAKFVEVQNTPDPGLFPVGEALEDEAKLPMTIVYHGTVAPRLGLDTLVEAVHLERDQLAGIRVVIIGDGDAADDIEALIRQRSLGDIIDFQRGFIPVDQLLPQLVAASIGVVPARNDPFTAGMLPSKLLEYVTLGIPTACADLPAVRRYFRDDQLAYFAPGEPQALGSLLVELSHDASARKAQAKRAMEFIDHHGWESERDRYFALIDSLSEHTRPQA